MQVDIERSVLLKGLGHAQSAVEKRNTVPVLSNVLLRAAEGHLMLIAGDLDLEIRIRLDAQVPVPGALTAPAHLLYDIVRKLPEDGQVLLRHAVDEGRLQVMSGRARFALPMLPEHDFPLMNFGGDERTFVLRSDACRRLIDKTRFAVSNEEVRYYLNGIYLHPAVRDGDPVLRAAATDGHRLARCDAPAPESADFADMPGVIIPRKTVAELRKLFDESDETVISVTETKIRVTSGDVTLTSKLIDGTFPDYERVIPTEHDRLLTADAVLFLRAVERVATVCTDKAPGVRLGLRAGRLEIAAGHEAGVGVARDEIEVEYSGPDLDGAFTVRCLSEVLGQISGRLLRMELGESIRPAVVRDDEDPGVLFLLMPVR